MKLFLLLSLLLSSYTDSFAAEKMDWQEGHGGDAVAYEFTETAREFLLSAELLGLEELPEDFLPRMRAAIRSTLVRSESKVLLEGLEVDAANYPNRNPPLILLHRGRWLQYVKDYRKKRLLAVHEYLSIAGIPDARYEVSADLVARLETLELNARQGKNGFLAGAIQNCEVQRVQEMLAQGASPFTRFEGGRSALHIAAESGCVNLVQNFLRIGLPVNQINEMGWSPLFSAIWFLHYSPAQSPQRDLYKASIRLLIENGADLNVQTASTVESMMLFPVVIRTQQTPLIRAMMGIYDLDAPGLYLRDDPELVALLLGVRGIDVNLSDSAGLSALHHAVALGRVDYLAALLQAGANPNLKNMKGESPMDLAATTQDRLPLLIPLLGKGGLLQQSALHRALQAIQTLPQDILQLFQVLSRQEAIQPELALLDAAKSAARLQQERGIRGGSQLVRILLEAPRFRAESCEAFAALTQLEILAQGRFGGLYSESLSLVKNALRGKNKPEACVATSPAKAGLHRLLWP